MLKTSLSLISVAVLIATSEADAAVTVTAAPAVTAPAAADTAALRQKTLPLSAMVPGGGDHPIRLTGSEPSQYFDFALRRDEAVVNAVLNLTMTASPSLLAETSQVNVYLNGELQTTVQLTKALLGQRANVEVPLDVRRFRAQNQLMLQFVGHYQPVCENPANEVLWLSVAPESALKLTTEKLKVANDLSLFPAPFIDAAGDTTAPAVLPIVFAGTPSRETKEAAALFASLAGKLAGWRGIEIPVYYNALPPERHFVVFRTKDADPTFLKDRPLPQGPAVTMADAPFSRTAKMLLISGTTGEDLNAAVLALADTKRVLIGETLAAAGTRPVKRAAWDAPKWLTENTPVTLADLAQYPGQLSAKSQSSARVTLPLNLAPDTWFTSPENLTLNLAYRYTRPVNHADAQLRVTVNDVLVDSENVSTAESRGTAKVTLPMASGALSPDASAAPAMKNRNALAMTLAYSRNFSEGSLTNCRSASLLPQQLEVEPGSTVTLSGAYHWAELPNLAMWLSGGFPYTKYADLSETALVAPKTISSGNLSVLLTSVARAAQATGLAGLNLTVAEDWTDNRLTDKDILAAGTLPEGALTDFSTRAAQELSTRLSKAVQAKTWEKTSSSSTGNAAVTAAFESPFTSGRTVTMLLTESDEAAQMLSRRLADTSDLSSVSGTLAVITPDAVYSYAAAPTFTSGNLPWYRQVWTGVSGHPLLVSLAALLCALLAGTGVYRFMRRQVKGRS